MQRDAAQKIAAIALDCSGKTDQSVARVMETQDEEVLFIYRRRAGHIMSSMLDIVAPLWNEHLDLAPRWYQESEERRARGTKRRIDPAMQREFLLLMDKVEQAMTSMVEIAADACDEPTAKSFRQGARRVVNEVNKNRTYLSSLERKADAGPADDPQ